MLTRMAIDPRLVSALHLRADRHADLPAAAREAHVAFQASTVEALMDGAYDGDLTIGELRSRGDLGLGTFDGLDGEMIVLDGAVWRARADGSVEAVGDEERTPFAVVTAFAPDATVAIDGPLEQEELLARAVRAVAAAAGERDGTSPAGACALRFDGRLEHVHARSVPRQRKPYPPLVEAAATQRELELGPLEGSLVGFVFPAWAGGVEIPGAHLHAIAADRTRGGHVLHARVGPGTLRVAALTDLHLELPPGVALPDARLDAVRADALARVEGEQRGGA